MDLGLAGYRIAVTTVSLLRVRLPTGALRVLLANGEDASSAANPRLNRVVFRRFQP